MPRLGVCLVLSVCLSARQAGRYCLLLTFRFVWRPVCCLLARMIASNMIDQLS